jgi:hypothetical protein
LALSQELANSPIDMEKRSQRMNFPAGSYAQATVRWGILPS